MMQAQQPHPTALTPYQLPFPLELSVTGAVLALWPPPTAHPQQVWSSLPPTERLRAHAVFVQVLREVVRNGARD